MVLALCEECVEADLVTQALGDDVADAGGAALLVLVVLEGALQQEGVEREVVARGRDVRADDVGAGRRTGAGEEGEQAGICLLYTSDAADE